MESSPANRLPEAHSLPDGFVESSGDTEVASLSTNDSDYKVSLIDLDCPGDGGDRVAPEGVAGAPETESALEVSKDADATIEVDDVRRRNPERDVEGCLDLRDSINPKEGSTAEQSECLKNRKAESAETKKKTVKRSIKNEKELLEFTLNYQKVIAERDAAVVVREKLESLCRELQRQNKMLMDECQRVATEGQNMRLDLSTKLNDAIKDVGNKLESQKDECLTQLKENEMLRSKLKHLADQYALSEQQFAQKLKQKTLELQISDLKFQQQQEKSTQEQTQLQLYVEQVSQLLATENNLRTQLAADGEKFQQFQDALLKSNEVFETFKQEMEKMGKLIKELKKENVFLKSKCENSDVAIVKLIEEREHMKKQLEKAKNQKEKLESLCRSLQAERKQNMVTGYDVESATMEAKSGSAVEDSRN